MDNLKIVGAPLPDMPWEDRPEGSKEVLWRYSKNPVIPRDILPTSNSVFNSAVVPFKGGYAGVFRCDDTNRRMRLHVGFSADAIHWSISETKLEFECDDKEIGEFVYAYDPRVCFIEDRYYVTWCNGYHGPTIGVAYTFDFETFHQLENAYLPFNRNGVMFPRKINGNFAMLSRPSDNGHTPFGDIFYSESPDMCFWGKHRHVMSPAAFEDSAWQCTKIGAGPIPIETSEGWLLIYHGVLRSCNGYVYSFGSAILDLEQPWKVKFRSGPYLLSPQKDYECMGDVPNVVFPCAALHDPETKRIAIYYGCADTVNHLTDSRRTIYFCCRNNILLHTKVYCFRTKSILFFLLGKRVRAMTKIQQFLADLPEEKKSLFVPVFGSMEKFYTVVYLIARNEHVTDQEKPDRYEDRLQVIRQIRNRVEKLVSSYGLDGGEIVADIASDYFEDYVNYKEPELDITNDGFIAILQKI